MVLRANNREAAIEMGAEGGKGKLVLDKLTNSAVKPSNVTLYAHAKLEPGASVGYHVHRGESEMYYILSGKGLYSDNGTAREVVAGDVTYTLDGEGHSLENAGSSILEFIAFIVRD